MFNGVVFGSGGFAFAEWLMQRQVKLMERNVRGNSALTEGRDGESRFLWRMNDEENK